MKTDEYRAEPWYTKNSMLVRKVRYVLGLGCWCCGYETEYINPWPVNSKYYKWCMYCKYAMCSVCNEGGRVLGFKDRLKSVLTSGK